jgi:hypothetical protein
MLQSLSGVSLMAALGGVATAGTSDQNDAKLKGGQTDATPATVVAQGTLTLDHAQGRKLVGFVQTGIAGGVALCSLANQHPGNPAVESVFATPDIHDGITGVRVTVSFYTEPVGELDFSLLHIALHRTTSPVGRLGVSSRNLG